MRPDGSPVWFGTKRSRFPTDLVSANLDVSEVVGPMGFSDSPPRETPVPGRWRISSVGREYTVHHRFTLSLDTRGQGRRSRG